MDAGLAVRRATGGAGPAAVSPPGPSPLGPGRDRFGPGRTTAGPDHESRKRGLRWKDPSLRQRTDACHTHRRAQTHTRARAHAHMLS